MVKVVASFASIIALLVSDVSVYGLSEDTHALINIIAADLSDLNSVLKDKLGQRNGLETEFLGKGKTVTYWIGEGGKREDDGSAITGTARYFRHFHDPLRAWGEAGLHPINPLATRWESAVRWAQQTNQDQQTKLGDYSWVNARQYFLQALTAESAVAREQAFAQTFRALGQLMHLITDMSVPEHVRDDMHPLDGAFGYEGWVLAQHRGASGLGGLAPYLQGAPPIDPALYALPLPPGEAIATAPIARLFDSDRYAGSFPDPAVTAEGLIGLAEVTNANFFSPDTIAKPYPHPALAALQPYAEVYDKTGVKRTYYRKPQPGLVVEPVMVECVINELSESREVCADQAVWRETARHLLPRAVGYSAALLDHFFRGKLEAVRVLHPTTGVPSLRIVNRSAEALGGTGRFWVAVFDANGLRTKFLEHPLTAEVPADNTDAPFYLPLPTLAAGERLTVAYRGPLGAESDAVIGQTVPPVTLEEVYWDGDLGWWALRTVAGRYVLPFNGPDGTPIPCEHVTWGERDNQLLCDTWLPGSEVPWEVALFEIARPAGSADVPVTEWVYDGVPEAALTFVTRTEIYPTLGALPPPATVTAEARLEVAQYLVDYTVTKTCRDANPDPAADAYVCTVATGGDTVTQVLDWQDTAMTTFPLALVPEHHADATWNPPNYAWEVASFRVDRNNHLVALLRIRTTRLPAEEGARHVALKERDGRGALVESSRTVTVMPTLADVPGMLYAVVDLTDRRVLGTTSDPEIRLQWTQRTVLPSAWGALYVSQRYREVYEGGTRHGQGAEVWAGGWINDLPANDQYHAPVRVADGGGSSLRGAPGLWRPSLAAAGLADRTTTGMIRPWGPPGVRYRIDDAGVAVICAVGVDVPIVLGPAARSHWAGWWGPAPGRLRFEAYAWEENGSNAGTRLVDWDLARDQARTVFTDLAPEPWNVQLANASGALALRWDRYDAAGGWMWLSWMGSPQVFDDPVRDAWDYVAVEPDYLYSLTDERFHAPRANPNLPPDYGPDPLVSGGRSFAGYRDFHVVGR